MRASWGRLGALGAFWGVLRDSRWCSGGPGRPPGDPKSPPRDPKRRPRGTQELPRELKKAPKRPQEGSKSFLGLKKPYSLEMLIFRKNSSIFDGHGFSLGSLWPSWGGFGGDLGGSWRSLGGSWACLGDLGRSWRRLRPFRGGVYLREPFSGNRPPHPPRTPPRGRLWGDNRGASPPLTT